MTVPFAFANLSGNIALAKLDSNFNTPITIGNTSVLLGNTVTTLNNLTLANVTITSGTSNVTNVNVTNVTVTNLTATLANVTTLNVASAYITSANIGTLALTNALPVSSGGTGQVTFPANSVLLGNGTGGIATVSPGNVGNVLTSIGGVWVSNVALSGAAAGANTQVQYNNSGALGASANLTFNGTTLTANTLNLTNALGTTYGGTGLTSFTANGVVYASSSSALTTGSALVFDGTNLGLGATPSAWGSGKAIEFGFNGNAVWSFSQTDSYLTNNARFTDAWRYVSSAAASTYRQNAGAHSWAIAPSGTAGNAITFTQAMTLDSSGNLLVGTTSTLNSGKLSVDAAGTNGITCQVNDVVNPCFQAWSAVTSGNPIFVNFATEGTFTSRGAISYNRGAGLVVYATTSDYRAKDIIGPVQDSGATIDALKVYEGQMKGATQSRPMLVAHEAQAITPYAVTGEKDAVKEDGTPDYQQMDVSSLVPLLIAEIQSLRIRIAQLENKL
jgi:hypothetical protein